MAFEELQDPTQVEQGQDITTGEQPTKVNDTPIVDHSNLEPDPPTDAQKLYQHLINDKKADGTPKYTENELGTSDEFSTAISDSANADKIYSTLINDGYTTDDLGTKDIFLNTFTKKKSGEVGQPGLQYVPQWKKDLDSKGTLPEQAIAAQDPNDIVAQAFLSDEKRKKEIPFELTGYEEPGMSYSTGTPDLKSQAEADKIDADIVAKGYDPKKLRKDFTGIDDVVFRTPGLSKNELLTDYINNPVLYERKISTAKFQRELYRQSVKQGDLTPFNDAMASYKYAKDLIEQGQPYDMYNPADVFNYQLVNNNIDKIDDETARKEIKNNFFNDVIFQYGSQKVTANDPLLQQLGGDENAVIGYRIIKDLRPEALTKYDVAKLSDTDIGNNIEPRQNLRRELNQIGENAKMIYANQNLDQDKKEYESLVTRYNNNEELTQEEVDRANFLKDKMQPFQDMVAGVVKDQAEGHDRYTTSYLTDAHNAAQDVLGVNPNPVARAGEMLGFGIEDMVYAIPRMIATPLLSEKNQQIMQSDMLGENIWRETMTRRSMASYNDKSNIYMQPELEAQVNAIQNDKKLTEDEKLNKVTTLFNDNQMDWHRGEQEEGGVNKSISSLVYGVSDLAINLVPFIVAEYFTGGIAGGASAGTIAKLTSTFTAAAVTSYNNEYVAAVQRGDKNPYASAMISTAINSAAMAGAGTPAAIRKMLGNTTAIGKMISKLTDDNILVALRTEPGALSFFKKSQNLVKNVGTAAIGGTKTAAKITALTTGGQVAADIAIGQQKTPEEYGKGAALSFYHFSALNMVLGVGGKVMKESGITDFDNDVTKASIYEGAKNPIVMLNVLSKKVNSGEIKPDDANIIRNNIMNANRILESSPMLDATGNKLSDKAQRDLLFLKMQESDIDNTLKKDIPDDLAKTLYERLNSINDKMDAIYKGSYGVQLVPIKKVKEEKPLENIALPRTANNAILDAVSGGAITAEEAATLNNRQGKVEFLNNIATQAKTPPEGVDITQNVTDLRTKYGNEVVDESLKLFPIETKEVPEEVPDTEIKSILGQASIYMPSDKLEGIQTTVNKINNAEQINENELNATEDDLYKILNDHPQTAHLIEPIIQKIQSYEFATKTETVQTTEKVPVDGTRQNRTKPVTKHIEQWEGSNATVTDEKGNQVSGVIKIEDGQYHLFNDNGEKVVTLGEKAITDRDITLPSEIDIKKRRQDEIKKRGLDKIFPVEIDETTPEGKKLAKEKVEQEEELNQLDTELNKQNKENVSPFEFDKDGNVTSITLQTNKIDTEGGGRVKDKTIKIELKDPEKALDYAISLRAEQVGEVPDAAFEAATKDVIKEHNVEVPVERPKIVKKPKEVKVEGEVTTKETDIEKRNQEIKNRGLDRLFPVEIDETTPEGKKLAKEKIEQEEKIKQLDVELNKQKEVKQVTTEGETTEETPPPPKKKTTTKSKIKTWAEKHLPKPGEREEQDTPPQEVTSETLDKIDATGYDKEQKGVINDVKKVTKAISALVKSTTGKALKVVLHSNNESFIKAAEDVSGESQEGLVGNGFYMGSDGTIHLNMPKVNKLTMKHEGFHPILDYIQDKSPEKIHEYFNALKSIQGAEEIVSEAERIYAEDGDLTIKKEAITDFVSKVADGSIEINNSNFAKVKNYVVGLLNKLGLGISQTEILDLKNAKDLRDLANLVTGKFKTGEELTPEEIAKAVSINGEKPEDVTQKKGKTQFQKGDELTIEPKDYEAAKKIFKKDKEDFKKNPEAVIPQPLLDKNGVPKIIVTEGDAPEPLLDKKGNPILDDKGNKVMSPINRDVKVLYKGVPYDLENGALKHISKNRDKAVESLANKLVEDYNNNKNKPEISAAIGWYGNMRKWFQTNFGANIEMFGQLLAATSARTEVVDNFKQAVDAIRNLAKGKYDDILKDYDNHVKEIKSLSEEELKAKWDKNNPTKRPSEFNANDYRRFLINQYEKVPLRSNGKKFNANSKKVLQALYGNWIEQTEGPKTKNFAGNLTGRSFEATIDVWAARYLRRKIFGDKVKQWRILPQTEGSVEYGKLKSGAMTGDYPFAEDVMRLAADKLNIKADDLQAFLWYLEKDVWDKNNWTNITGKKKASFEETAKTIESDRYQAAVTTFRDAETFDPVKFEAERKSIENEIGNIPGVIASRVNASEGEFVAPNETFVEPTFDVEFTVEKGVDISNVIKKVDEIQRKYNQDATIISQFVDKYHPNARPIIEVGLASPAVKSEIIEDIKKTLSDLDVRGFTIARDRQGKILGIRSQFVPEFEEGVTMDQGMERFVKGFKKIYEKYSDNKDISYLSTDFVDSRVKFNENGTKENEQNGGDSTSGPDIQGELRKQETEQGQNINDLSEKQGGQYEGRGNREGNGMAGESKISQTEINDTKNISGEPVKGPSVEGKGKKDVQFSKEGTPKETIEKAGLKEDEIEQWRKENKVSQKNLRVPSVQKAAEALKAGEITQDEYISTVRKEQPIKPFKEVPPVPSVKEIIASLDKNKVAKGIVGVNVEIPNGERVGLRLDIPAYENYDTYVVSIHEGAGDSSRGNALGYGQTGVIENVKFSTQPSAALAIAMGKAKSSIARMYGDWKNEDPQSVHDRAEKLLKDPSWTQVGLNLFRHSWFYDKTDGMPIKSAKEVIQVGALVLAKGVEKISPTDPMFKAGEVNGKPIQFSKAELPQQKEIKQLRANEQAEYDAMSDPKDKLKRQEIYDKYDKLITPLLKKSGLPQQKESTIQAVSQEQVIKQMKPFTDKMVNIEREFKNNGYEIDTDYDNEIQVLDKKGKQVEPEDLPDNLIKLAADYEKATSKLGEFDDRAREKALIESRNTVETKAEVVESKKGELPEPPQFSKSKLTKEETKVSEMKSIVSDYVNEGWGLEDIKELIEGEFKDINVPYDSKVEATIEQAYENFTTTSVKNRVTTRERLERGLKEIEVTAKRGYGKVFDNAKQMIADNEINPRLLAIDIAKNPRPLKAEETVALMIDRMNISNDYNKALQKVEAAQEVGDLVAEKSGLSELDVLEEDMKLNDLASKNSGYEQGLGLGIRQMLIRQDYSMATQLQRLRVANGGKELPKEYRQKLLGLTKKLDEANKALKELQAQTQADQIKTEVSSTKKTAKTPEQREAERKTIKDKIKDSWNAALEALKAKEEPKKQTGEGVQMSKIAFTTPVSPAKQAQLEAISKDVSTLVKSYAEGGMTDLNKIMDTIHNDLSQVLPGLTKADIQDVILGRYKIDIPKAKLTPAQLTAQAAVKKVQTQIDLLKDEIVVSQRGKGEMFWDYLHGWHRMAILSGVPSVGKIGMAALYRGLVTRVEGVVGAGLSLIPGVRYISKGAIREGRFNPKAEAKAFATWFSAMTYKDLNQVRKTGISELDYMYGNKNQFASKVPAWMETFGRFHAAIKLLPKRAEFFRSLEMRTQRALEENRDIYDPEVQQELGVAAYNDALRAVFMQDNVVTDMYKAAIDKAEKSDSPLGKVIAGSMKFLFPIVKVPTNYVGEQSSYAIGALKALKMLAMNYKDLTPDHKDYIMRALKKQSVGAAFIAMGYLNPNMFGGYYSGKRKDQDLKAGDVVIGGFHLPHWMMHTPLIEMLQLGATLRRSNDAGVAKGEAPSKLAGIPNVLKGISKQIPFIGGTERVSKAIESADQSKTFFMGLLTSVAAPQLIQNISDYIDTNEKGETIKRIPTNAKEMIMEATPFRKRLEAKKELFTSDDLKEPDFKLLQDKGVEIPFIKERLKIKVVQDDAHPDGVMTPTEYNSYAENLRTKVIQKVKEVLTSTYEIKEGEKSSYTVGNALEGKDLEDKVKKAEGEASKEILDEMKLSKASKKTVTKI